MDRVGNRELRQHARAVIRRVVAGESLEVTDRGRAVARIIPLRPAGVVDQMIAEGRAVPAHCDLLEVRPLRPLAGRPSLSEVLTDMRADER